MKKLILMTLLFLCFFIAAAMLDKPFGKTETADSDAEQEIIHEIVVCTPFSSYKASVVKTVKTDADKGTPGKLPKLKKYSKIEIMPGLNEPEGA